MELTTTFKALYLKLSVMWLSLVCAMTAQAQSPLDSLLSVKPILKTVSEQAAKYRLQIIYTQVQRDAKGVASFKSFTYEVDSSRYFYCASLVKLPCSILALEKINQLSDYGLTKNTILFTDSASCCQHRVTKDASSANGYPSVAQYIKRMLLVSDNLAFGRIYEFLGVDYLHHRLTQLGYKNMRIVHRFDGGCKGTENTNTNPVSFYSDDLKVLYQQKPQTASKAYVHPLGTVKVGHAYVNAQSKKINEPKDFSSMNYISLQQIHSILQRLVFDESVSSSQRYHLKPDDRNFLMTYLTLYPRESQYPAYDQKAYPDSYKKYFIYGDSKKPILDTNLKITNIVGQSYGFMVDCAYIHNQKENVEFMLSAVIYANEDEVINDGKYEYNTIALPFLAELGRQIYAYEQARSLQRKHK